MKNVIIEIGAVKQGQWKVRFVADPNLGIRGVRKTATLRLLIAAASINETKENIELTDGVPKLRELFRGMWCKSVDAKPMEIALHPVSKVKTMFWQIFIEYDSEMELSNA